MRNPTMWTKLLATRLNFNAGYKLHTDAARACSRASATAHLIVVGQGDQANHGLDTSDIRSATASVPSVA